jgi:anaerobic magnesium-protoporphyrin IX monomethyl ester cyclase
MSSFRVLFIYPNFRGETLVPPGVTLLSRILKNHGFEVEVFDTTDYGLNLSKDYEKLTEESLGVRPSPHRTLLNTDRDVWADLNDKVNSFGPNLLALSCTESTFLLGVEVVKRIQNRNPRDMPAIVGGSFATFAPARALDFPEIDMVCVGEGEHLLLELCRKMSQGEEYRGIQGLWTRDEKGSIRSNGMAALANLEENPTDFDLGIFHPERLVRPMAGKLYRMVPVETIRGCVYHCAFCNSRNTGGRKKSMSKVREELLHYKENFGVEYMFFWADTFLMMSTKELDEFCEIYRDVNLPFWVQTRVETITDPRLRKLKAAGLHRIAFGIENGNEEFRRKVVLKEFTNAEAVRAMEMTAGFDIPYNTNNIVGYPHETPEIFLDTIELNRRFPNVDTTNCFTFAPYYGTPARDEAVMAGFMASDLIAPGNAEDSVLNMPNFSQDEIHRARLGFSLKVKFEKSRWPEIDRALADVGDSPATLKALQEEYRERFFGSPKLSF